MNELYTGYTPYQTELNEDELNLEGWELNDLEEQFADIIQSKEEY